MKKTYIGLDLGTSAVKGVVVDESGAILAETMAKNALLRPHDGWVELDPVDHFECVAGVIRGLVEGAAGEVAGIAMGAASGNTLLTDARGEPLTNIISWMDARSENESPSVLSGLSPDGMRRVAGWPCVTLFPLAHLAWLKENTPFAYRNAARVCMNTDWLLFRLTGEWVMDYSTATTFHLQNQVERRYHKPFLEMLEIDESKLAKLADSGVSVGHPTAAAAKATSLPRSAVVSTGCFDHPAAARGVGVERPGQLLLSCGTSWVGFTPEFDRNRIIEAELLCDPFLSVGGGPWAGMFSISQIGQSVDWYIDNLVAPGHSDKYTAFEEAAELAESGAGGLKIDLTADPTHVEDSRENVSRAVMEGAAALLAKRLDALRSKGFEFSEAVMTGGPSKSCLWPRIVEEFTGLSITVGSEYAGAIGAAKLAAAAVKSVRGQ
ncbi:MAG: hypothetical protein KAG97_01185 [Victivallales bacterium]|nr:hypothetical protein [Victivallales bacterium]